MSKILMTREVKNIVPEESETQNRLTNIIVKGVKERSGEDDLAMTVRGILKEVTGWASAIQAT
jgi:hypothetical protein